MLRRLEQARENGSNPSNRTNFRYLSTPQKATKLKEMQKSLKRSQKQVKQLKSLLEDRVQDRSMEVDGDMHGDLCTIMEENHTKITDKYQPGECIN